MVFGAVSNTLGIGVTVGVKVAVGVGVIVGTAEAVRVERAGVVDEGTGEAASPGLVNEFTDGDVEPQAPAAKTISIRAIVRVICLVIFIALSHASFAQYARYLQ
jgi:hypothetical protein